MINSSTLDLIKLRAKLLTGLQTIVDDEFILSSNEQLKAFECDGLSVYKSIPLLAVLPENADEVKAVVRLCHLLRVPIVGRGAGTGLSAGAQPLTNGLLLVMSRMNRILEIDSVNQTAVLEPGVRNLAISEASEPHNLFYAPDPSSQIACSIGGNVAENAGGMHCLKYGLTVHNILQLKVVTMSGEEIVLGGGGYDAPGFNIQALVVGSEGMLGIVIEVTVRLLPKPSVTRTMVAAFDNVEKAGKAVSNIIAAGIIPAALEMLDNYALCAAEDYANAGYPRDAKAILIAEVDGSERSTQEQLEIILKVLNQSGVASIKLAKNEHERLLFWKGRKSAFPAVGRISPDYYCMDGTIPRSALAEVLQHIDNLSEQYQLKVANVFHAGDGNLHPLILFDANIEGELERVEEMGAQILEKCIRVGGTITGEHGVGLEKIRQMPLQFSDAEIAQFHGVKKALDPLNLLNPGKNIPLLKHCQEYRALSRAREPNASSLQLDKGRGDDC